MNRMLPLITLFGVSLAAVPHVSAEPTTPPSTSTDNKGSTKKLAEFSAKYGVPEQELISLRHQGLGWGEIGLALAISQKAGVPLATVVQLRQSGLGWGQIAQKYGFKLGSVARQARTAAREGRRAQARENEARGMPTRPVTPAGNEGEFGHRTPGRDGPHH